MSSRLVALAAAVLASTTLRAQQAAPAQPEARAPAQLERVEVTGERGDDVEERRQSTAAKIVIGREEIERFGDSSVSEVLKRLPGVKLQAEVKAQVPASSRSEG